MQSGNNVTYDMGLRGPVVNTVTALDIFQTSVISIRWQKRFMETGHTVTETGQIHGPHWKSLVNSNIVLLK